MRNWLIGLALVFLLAAWQGIHLVYTVFAKQNEWKQEGMRLAKEQTAMQTIDEVSVYNGKQSFIVVEGKNDTGTPMIAWFREGRMDALAYPKELTDKESVRNTVMKENPQAEIVRIVPGMEDGHLLWEVFYVDQQGKFNYAYYDMKTGHFIRSYRLQKMEN